MLSKLKDKFSNYDITCILDDYFKYEFKDTYNAIVSVESLHHFEKEKKVSLYKKLYKCLCNDGVFILTDYFSKDDEEEKHFYNELKRLKKEQNIQDNEFYHYDTPLTLNHEIEALKEAGFIVEVIKSWGATSVIKATKPNRILVIGCPGSGKSTLSRKLKEKTNLPLCHLDMIFWNEDKTTVDQETFMNRLTKVVESEKWIIDGNFSTTMELRIKECDTIIFLDFDVETCLEGVKSRIGKKRDDIPWIEEQEDEEFMQFIKDFNRCNRPKILELLDKYQDKNILIFKNREEVNQYFKL